MITPNTNYIVLKPGATRTITAKATPASASQSFTFKSGNSSIATVSPTGVVTGGRHRFYLHYHLQRQGYCHGHRHREPLGRCRPVLGQQQ